MTYCGGDDGMKERDEVRESVPILVYKDGRLVCQGLSDIAKACGGHCKSGMSIETTFNRGKQQTIPACCLFVVRRWSFVVGRSYFVQRFRPSFLHCAYDVRCSFVGRLWMLDTRLLDTRLLFDIRSTFLLDGRWSFVDAQHSLVL